LAEDTILRALKLFPHFLTDMDGDFSDVALVLSKMLERTKRIRAIPFCPGMAFPDDV